MASTDTKLTALPERTRLEVVSFKRVGETTYTNRLGSAFVNGDGSLNLVLDAFPVDGKLTVRVPRARRSSTSEEQE